MADEAVPFYCFISRDGSGIKKVLFIYIVIVVMFDCCNLFTHSVL